MLDSDLAELYRVETRVLIQAVKRNAARFPGDFMFQLDGEEAESLRSQIVISNEGRGGRRYLPYVFTEQGVAMLATVLNSERAVQMSIRIIRVFVKLRELLATHKDLAAKVEKLDKTQKQHGTALVALIQDVQKLKNPPATPKKRIGFHVPEGK